MKRFLSIILATIISFSVLSSVSFAASDYNSYRAEVDNLNKLSVPLQGQSYRVVKNGDSYKSKSNDPGICNIVAATQLLNRRLAYDSGNSVSSSNAFTMSDVISACGNTVTAAGVDFNHTGKNNKKYYGNGYEYNGNGTGDWYNYSFTAKNGNRYRFVHVSKPTMTKSMGIDTEEKFNEYLASVLIEHPEGVHYRGKNHCIVFTDFIKNGDSYIFYAIDGVDAAYGCLGRHEVTKTWQCMVGNGGNSVKNFYASMSNDINGYIAYIDAPKKPTHTCAKYETYKKGSTKVLGACKDCHTPYNWQSQFVKKTEKLYLTKDNSNYKIKIYNAPYEDADCLSSKKIIKSIDVVGTITKNAYGSTWYAIKYQYEANNCYYDTAYIYSKDYEKYSPHNYDPGQTYTEIEAVKYNSPNYISAEHKHDYTYDNGMCICGERKVVTYDESTLKINLTRYPSKHTQGKNFGLRGTISSNYKIKKIYGYIKQNGNVIQSTEDSPNAKSVDVRDKNLNNNLIFEKLGPGKYTLEVVAIDAAGNSIKVVKDFTVVAEVIRAESTLSINLEKYPVTLIAGSGFGLRGSVNSNYNISVVRGYVIDSNGNTKLSSQDTPNSTSMDIGNARLNNDLIFNNLSAGNYTLKVVATDSAGKTVEVIKNFSVVSSTKNNNSTLSINLEKYPVTLEINTAYGLRGTVTSNYNISVVRGYVTNSSGQTVLSSTDIPNSAYMDIQPSNLNWDLVFNKLSAGNYTMRVVAVDASGRTVEVSKNFTVKAKAAYIDNTANGNGVTGTVNIPSSWDNLSIRTGPSTSYGVIGSMNQGARCTVYPDKASNGWYYVEYNGIRGYASGSQIKLQ